MWRNLCYLLLGIFGSAGIVYAADTADISAAEPSAAEPAQNDIMRQAKLDMIDYVLQNSTDAELAREAKRIYLMEKNQAKMRHTAWPPRLSEEMLHNREKLCEYIKAHINIQ